MSEKLEKLLAEKWSGPFKIEIDNAEWQYTHESWHELKVGNNAFIGSVLEGDGFEASADEELIGTFPTLVEAKLAVLAAIGAKVVG